MTRDELLEALLVERFGKRPTKPTKAPDNSVRASAAYKAAYDYLSGTTVHDDSEITTARRRRELAEATRDERKSA